MMGKIREAISDWGCLAGWHTWTDGETYREHAGVMVLRKCRYCGWPARQRMATQREAQRFAEEESMQRTLAQEAEGVSETRTLRLHSAPPAVGASRASALPLATREQVERLRKTWRPDEVAAQVMEAGIGREEPLVPRRWTVDSRVARRGDVAAGLTCPRDRE